MSDAAVMTDPSVPTPRRRAGMGLFELMAALAISATLLTTLAIAVDSSIKAYKINQEQASLLQHARVALHRITHTVRNCTSHAPIDAGALSDFKQGRTVSDTGIALVDDDGNDICFYHDPAARVVIAELNGTKHTLAHGVEEFSVALEPMQSAASRRRAGPYDLLRRVSVRMTLRTTGQTAHHTETTGRQTVTLTASVAPRENSW